MVVVVEEMTRFGREREKIGTADVQGIRLLICAVTMRWLRIDDLEMMTLLRHTAGLVVSILSVYDAV